MLWGFFALLVLACFALMDKMGWRELAIFYLLKIEGNKMLKTWMETMKEEIVTLQEEFGSLRDRVVAREQRRLMVISAVKQRKMNLPLTLLLRSIMPAPSSSLSASHSLASTCCR